MLSPQLLLPLLLYLPSWTWAWQPLGFSSTPSSGLTGIIADLSNDGRRLALGDPSHHSGDGIVRLFELDTSGASWNLLVEIPGEKDEGFGGSLSLSPDGRMVAVRRNHIFPNGVQVYQVFGARNSIFHYHPMGALIQGPANGTQLSLSQADADYFLLASYEDFDMHRGMVQAYKMIRESVASINGTIHWKPIGPAVVGAQQGDRCGHAADIIVAPSPTPEAGLTLQVVVGSPYRGSKRGAVQVFSLGANGWEEQGLELAGAQPGEEFGHSLAMSSGSFPLLVVGSPFKHHGHKFNATGSILVFKWQGPDFESSSGWKQIGENVVADDLSQFGHSVAVSDDGSRFASISVGPDHSMGGIHVFEMDSGSSYSALGRLPRSKTQGTGYATSVAMNAQGSVIAIASSSSASILVDNEPFCRLPSAGSSFEGIDEDEATLSAFMDRETCYNGPDLIKMKLSCELTMIYANGDWKSCEWESRSLGMEKPSTAPAIPPAVTSNASSGGSRSPSGSPTGPAIPFPTLSPSLFEPYPYGKAPSLVSIDENGNTTNIKNPSDETGPVFIRACQCNERKRCISKKLQYGSNLNLCLRMPSSSFSFFAIVQLNYTQGNYSAIMIDNYLQLSNQKVVETCDGRMCSVELPVSEVFFGDDSSVSILQVSGTAAIVPSIPHTLRGVETYGAKFLSFKANVKLEEHTSSNGAAAEKAPASVEWAREKTSVAAWVALAAASAIGLLAFYFCIEKESAKRASVSSDEATNTT
mmetsp:Transcript_4796/g.13991  ORF Transcript_4796/g.13991 Transcript_4796/m.13991 type:complete len:754 (-) Transcript_4796:2995-5256(-)